MEKFSTSARPFHVKHGATLNFLTNAREKITATPRVAGVSPTAPPKKTAPGGQARPSAHLRRVRPHDYGRVDEPARRTEIHTSCPQIQDSGEAPSSSAAITAFRTARS